MFQQQSSNETLRPFSWGSNGVDIYDPLWEDFQRACAALPAEKSWEQKLIAVFLALPLFFSWPKRRRPFARPSFNFRGQTHAIFLQIHQTLWSPAFWLGVIFGAITRFSTRIAIEAAFASSPRLGTAAGFIACACAGLAAGMVTYLIRTWYRNAHRPAGTAKEKYWNKALFASALIGLFGGTLGGYVAQAGVVTAQSGGLIVGAGAGVTTGAVRAGIAARKVPGEGPLWQRMVYQSAFFGVLGGATGVIAADLLSVHASIAAPPSGEDLFRVAPSASDVSSPPLLAGSPHLWPQESTLMVAPVHHVSVQADDTYVLTSPPAAPPTVAHDVIQHPPSRPTLSAHDEACAKPKVRHIVHHKHAIRHPKPVVHKNIVLDTPKVLTPPQEVLPPPLPKPLPPPPPQTINPCADGLCDQPPCKTSSVIKLEGPCADPRTPCSEKIVFNDKGEATHAVLEPRRTSLNTPYLEIENPQEGSSRWVNVAHGLVRPVEGPESKVALVVPVQGGNQGLSMVAPMPV